MHKAKPFIFFSFKKKRHDPRQGVAQGTVPSPTMNTECESLDDMSRWSCGSPITKYIYLIIYTCWTGKPVTRSAWNTTEDWYDEDMVRVTRVREPSVGCMRVQDNLLRHTVGAPIRSLVPIPHVATRTPSSKKITSKRYRIIENINCINEPLRNIVTFFFSSTSHWWLLNTDNVNIVN